MFENFYNSLNSLEYQYSVHNSLLHLHSNFQLSALFNALYFRNERAEQLCTKCLYLSSVPNVLSDGARIADGARVPALASCARLARTVFYSILKQYFRAFWRPNSDHFICTTDNSKSQSQSQCVSHSQYRTVGHDLHPGESGGLKLWRSTYVIASSVVVGSSQSQVPLRVRCICNSKAQNVTRSSSVDK